MVGSFPHQSAVQQKHLTAGALESAGAGSANQGRDLRKLFGKTGALQHVLPSAVWLGMT